MPRGWQLLKRQGEAKSRPRTWDLDPRGEQKKALRADFRQDLQMSRESANPASLTEEHREAPLGMRLIS
jgi:hypothetical protein